MWELEGKSVIVTGGAKGIGESYVRAFAHAGASVALADLDRASGQRLADELSSLGSDVFFVPADVSNSADCRAMAEQVWNRWKRVDVLVNNAAIYAPLVRKSFVEIDGDEWDRVMAVNLRGMFFCCQAVFPYMKERSSGKIVNISSSTVLNGSPFFIHYVTSKAGVLGFTRSLARETGEHGITVNAIAPGLTVSGTNVSVTPPERFQKAIEGRCVKRPEIPEDLVGVVLFLSSRYSDFITGQLINVDGGANMY